MLCYRSTGTFRTERPCPTRESNSQPIDFKSMCVCRCTSGAGTITRPNLTPPSPTQPYRTSPDHTQKIDLPEFKTVTGCMLCQLSDISCYTDTWTRTTKYPYLPAHRGDAGCLMGDDPTTSRVTAGRSTVELQTPRTLPNLTSPCPTLPGLAEPYHT